MSIKLRLPRWLRNGGRHIGKVRYGSLATAQDACNQMAKKGSDGLTPYFCMVCNGYHIGHEPSLIVKLEKLK